jgi:hypothetical protein
MIDIELERENSRACISVEGELFTEYRYGHYECRPYFYPLLTPGGQRLTRGYPTERIAGEAEDHYHHRSLYVAHGLVNGYNLWDESTDHGSMLQRGDPVAGVWGEVVSIDGMVDWFGPQGQRLLEERRTIHVRAEGELRILDHRSELRARYGEVTLGDTKEGGMLALRVATSMDASGHGRIENSEGQIYDSGQGEEVTWGRPAAWVDYSGPLADGRQWGLSVADHRDNPRHPSRWHVRGYGLFAANPFGVHDYEADESLDASLTIPAGDRAVFSYRLIIHPGRGVDGHRRVRPLIAEFLNS